MFQFSRHIALAIALLFVFTGNADAQRARTQKAKTAKVDGRTARSAIKAKYKAKGLSQNIRVKKFGKSHSGKSTQFLVESTGSGKVRAMTLRHSTGKVSDKLQTQAVSQSAARKAANSKLRRQDGTFSGVNSSGLSKSGKSYKFNSATDRSKKTGDKAYVNARTGKASKRIRGE